ncbi:MAG: hypothetical protein N2C14_05650, partial [Planctomycetales bacterium]
KDGVRERHRNMKSHVHEVIAELGGDDYSRTLMDVGAPAQAWVYHPLTSNPYRYRPLDRSDHDDPVEQDEDALPSGLRNPVPLADQSATLASAEDGAYGTDSQGRLVIGSEMISQLGLVAGDAADLVLDDSNEEARIMRPSVIRGEAPDETCPVDDDGKIRLTQAVLDKAGLGGLQCYRVAGSGNLITVREF